MEPVEYRAFAECRIEPSTDGVIRGYAIVFDSLSLDLGGFREIIKPEAVDRTLAEAADVRALVDHDASKIIGRTRAGTLSMQKRSKGLYVQIQPDNQISYANDIMRAVARGDVTGMSFGFRTITDNWRMEDGETVRDVLDMRVSEVSVVTFPAYPETSVEAAKRSLDQFREQQRRSSIAWRARLLRNAMAK